MASFADCLQEMLTSDALKFPDKDGVLTLKEKRSGQRAKLIETPPDLIAVDIRKFSKIAQGKGFQTGGWKRGKGWRQSCDYMLVFQENGNDRALLVDLKKTRSNLNDEGMRRGLSQVRWSRAIFDYLRSLCEILREAAPGSLKVAVDYALICETNDPNLDKDPVQLNPGEALREPYKNIEARIALGTTLYWKRLLSN